MLRGLFGLMISRRGQRKPDVFLSGVFGQLRFAYFNNGRIVAQMIQKRRQAAPSVLSPLDLYNGLLFSVFLQLSWSI